MTDLRPRSTPTDKKSQHSAGNRLARLLWGLVCATLFRFSPRPLHAWRRFLLARFGARLHPTARVYPRARVWAPWNLVMGEYATIADDVDCYCVRTITIGAFTTISQYAFLCGATHDHEDPCFSLVPRPISIGSRCWIAADVFVAPGVTIGDGTVVGARSSVFTDLPAWKICVGSPAKPVKDRVIRPGPPGPAAAALPGSTPG